MRHLVCSQGRSDHVDVAATLRCRESREPLHIGVVEIDAGLLHICRVPRRARLGAAVQSASRVDFPPRLVVNFQRALERGAAPQPVFASSVR